MLPPSTRVTTHVREEASNAYRMWLHSKWLPHEVNNALSDPKEHFLVVLLCKIEVLWAIFFSGTDQELAGHAGHAFIFGNSQDNPATRGTVGRPAI